MVGPAGHATAADALHIKGLRNDALWFCVELFNQLAVPLDNANKRRIYSKLYWRDIKVRF